MDVYNVTKKHLDWMVITFQCSKYSLKSVGDMIVATLSGIGYEDVEYIFKLLGESIHQIDPNKNIGITLEVQDVGNDYQYIIKITSPIDLKNMSLNHPKNVRDGVEKENLKSTFGTHWSIGNYFVPKKWNSGLGIYYLILVTIFMIGTLTILLMGWEKSITLLENKIGPWISEAIRKSIFGHTTPKSQTTDIPIKV